MAQASQAEVRAFDMSTPEGESLPSADLNPDLSKAIQEYNPADTFQAPTAIPASQIKDSDISSIIKGAMESVNKASSMKFAPYKSPDVQPYLDSVNQIRAIYNDNVGDLETQRKLSETAAKAKVEGLKEEGYAKIEESAADQARAQKIADINAILAHDLGPAGNAERVAEKTQIFHSLNDRAIVLKESAQQDLEKLRQEEGVNPLDDPLRWLGGIFTIPQMSDQIEAKQQQINILNNELSGVFADIQSNVAALKDANEYRQKAVPAITAAQAAAKQNIVAADSAIKVADTDSELAKQNSVFAGIKFAETVTLGSAEHAALTASLEDARLKFESDSRAVLKADNDAKAKLMVAKLAMDLQDREQIDGILRLYEKRTGNIENSWNYTQFMRSPENVRNYIVGQALGFTGTTPGDALYNMKDMAKQGVYPGPNLPPQKAAAIRWMNQFSIELENSPKFKALAGKEQQQAYVKEEINKRFDQMQQNPTFDQQNNPFYEATPRDVTLHSPAFAQSKPGKLLEPQIKGQVQPDTATVVATLVQGAANMQEAAQMVSQYYQLNLKVRNSMNDYSGIGYRLRNDSYYWRDILPGSVFSTPEFTDLTKAESVTRMLLHREAMKIQLELPAQPLP